VILSQQLPEMKQKTLKNRSSLCQSLGYDMNLEPPEYEAGTLPTEL
jgi:hypothetical protein